MRIIQISNGYVQGDGVGNCIQSIDMLLKKTGYLCCIFACFVDDSLKKDNVFRFTKINEISISSDDIVLYHFCDGTNLNMQIENLVAKKILIYHNVTPPKYFRGISKSTFLNCLCGEFDAKQTVEKYNYCIALSEFSKNELMQYGWQENKICVIPIISINKFVALPEKSIVNQYLGDCTNLLFTGRVVPNKKIEDILFIFKKYQEINAGVRLFLVGNIPYKNYFKALQEYIDKNNIKNVFFTGKVTNSELEAYYKIADVFICMSEHEGFCIPLLEAMKRKIPVIAYSATAIPDTIGNAGILVNKKDCDEISNKIDAVTKNDDYRNEIINKQSERVNSFSIEAYKDIFISILKKVSLEPESKSVQLQNVKLNIDNESVFDIDKAFGTIGNVLKNEKIVVYGLGRVGKYFVDELLKHKNNDICLCDNSTDITQYKCIPVFRHNECVEQFKNYTYIVTVQNEFVSIMKDLLSSGISLNQIIWFDKQRLEFVK